MTCRSTASSAQHHSQNRPGPHQKVNLRTVSTSFSARSRLWSRQRAGPRHNLLLCLLPKPPRILESTRQKTAPRLVSIQLKPKNQIWGQLNKHCTKNAPLFFRLIFNAHLEHSPRSTIQFHSFRVGTHNLALWAPTTPTRYEALQNWKDQQET